VGSRAHRARCPGIALEDIPAVSLKPDTGVGYVKMLRDKATMPKQADRCIARLDRPVVREIDAGHSVMVSNPKALATAIEAIRQETGARIVDRERAPHWPYPEHSPRRTGMEPFTAKVDEPVLDALRERVREPGGRSSSMTRRGHRESMRHSSANCAATGPITTTGVSTKLG